MRYYFQPLRYCRMWSNFRYQAILTQLRAIRDELGLGDEEGDEEEEEEKLEAVNGELKPSANG